MPGHRLIIVGDPKQAIYSFRGANVQTYLAAREAMREAGAEMTPLVVNWRSYPPLLASLNRLFCTQQGCFFSGLPCSAPQAHYPGNSPCPHRPGEVKAQCPCVGWPGEGEVRARLSQDHSGRDPLTLVSFPEGMKAAPMRASYARFVARRSSGRQRHRDRRGGENRPLQQGDICILVRSRGSTCSLSNAPCVPAAFLTSPRGMAVYLPPRKRWRCSTCCAPSPCRMTSAR